MILEIMPRNGEKYRPKFGSNFPTMRILKEKLQKK